MISRVHLVGRFLVLMIVLGSPLSCAGPHGLGVARNVSKLEIEYWHELRSADFVLYSRGPKEHLETFAVDLARYVAVVEQLVHSQPPKAPARIFLVEDRASELFIPHPSIGGYMGHSLAGFGGFMRGAAHDPAYRNLLLHEYSHYLHLRSSNLNYPDWYTEGFAEFLGATRTRDDVMEVGSAPPWILLQLEHRRLRKEEIDLATIFSFERDGIRSDPSDFYPISWAVVHYLSSNATRHRQMVSMLKNQSAGLHWKQAYNRSFSESIELLSSRVSRHAKMLSRGTPGAVSYLPLDSLEVRDHWEIREVPPQEILRLFGEAALRNTVYLSGGRKANMQLAEALFRRANGFDPSESTARAGRAAALSAQSRFDEAEMQLAAFRDDPDPSVESIVYAADATRWHAVGQGEGSEATLSEPLLFAAIRLYQTALEAQPNDAFALAGLGYSQIGTGDFKAARTSLANARRVGEWDAQLTLEQGRVEKQLGFPAEASSFWNEVIRLGTEEEAKRAAALLDRINSN